MARPDLKPTLDRFVQTIATRNTYSGRPVSPSIMRLVQVEITPTNQGVTAPYWLGVLERGRGKRVSTKDSGLVQKIYKWMERRKMFKSSTAAGRLNEARGLTWYINKYGNQQFRSKTFIDIYTQARAQAIQEINAEYAIAIGRITQDII
jgi:hypothetical protein